MSQEGGSFTVCAEAIRNAIPNMVDREKNMLAVRLARVEVSIQWLTQSQMDTAEPGCSCEFYYDSSGLLVNSKGRLSGKALQSRYRGPQLLALNVLCKLETASCILGCGVQGGHVEPRQALS